MANPPFLPESLSNSVTLLTTQPLELDYFKRLGIALAIGLLIGLERGWSSRDKAEGMRVAGLRTYGLIGLLGGLWAMLAQLAGAVVIGFAFLAFTLIILSAYHDSLKRLGNFSMTGSIASLTTFSLGALSVLGHGLLAASTAVVITALLGFKPILHGWIQLIEQQELYATLKLLLISVVILPVLPNEHYGPFEMVNPYLIWWMVVLIAGISYLGYFAMKIVGNRHGSLLTGILGGLVSSTVVTIDLARLVKSSPKLCNALAAGILVAYATMFLRILLVIGILNSQLFTALLPALSVSGCLTLIMALLLWRQGEDYPTESGVQLKNPFQLGMALKFAGLLVIVMLLTHVLRHYFGDLGTYFVATLSGIADVDPITLSMAHSSKSAQEIHVAGNAILLAIFANSTFKSTLTGIIGNSALVLRVGGCTALAIAIGAMCL